MSGRLYVVGIGPGSPDMMTPQAHAALQDAERIYGYRTYLELLAPHFPEKQLIASDMRQELQRCEEALADANEGHRVAVVCSGDAGVYGMASPVLELAPAYPEVDVEVVCGVTAALAGAAVLGAPLAHDFCVVSLSDLLTPWPVIEKRLKAAAWADLCLCLYNPRSHHRPEHLARACRILQEASMPPERPCGVVKNIGRDEQEAHCMALSKLETYEADMFTTVFIGNSETRIVGGCLVTPRGYRS